MSNANLAAIKENITTQHENDEKQLEVIFSDSPRLIVEAPAGYGKTTTMISHIAYLFATGRIPNPKRILGLTFSVNAALKVKREVAEKLPSLLGSQNRHVAIGEKVTVTNYHGFCKGILKKYGYLIADALRRDINLFRAVGDSDIEKQASLKTAITDTELHSLKAVETAVKELRIPDTPTIHEYNQIVIKKLLPLDYVTHNAVILFVLEIFTNHAEVKKFYQSFYPLIVVDEFQDTNCIAWELLESIISDQTQLVFLGDPLQRIYGFIGALPNIMSTVIEKYGMTKVALAKNYRFRNNDDMLKLDKNIRENATTYFAPHISDKDIANLPAFLGLTQKDEARQVVAKVKTLTTDKDVKIAVLFRVRGKNAEIVEEELTDFNISYFYGMFKDDDAAYIDFHNTCRNMFINQFGKSKTINQKALSKFSDSVRTEFSKKTDKTINSLLRLLDALVKKVAVDYADLQPEDKYTLLLDIFENHQLKQAMEYVDSQVILSTVHGAKGLEWDYVIVCDVEKWVFPFICHKCPSKCNNNDLYCRPPQNIPPEMKGALLDDLCVFYVAITRAKKQAFISASKERFNTHGQQFHEGQVCCFASVNGVRLINAAPKVDDYSETLSRLL